MASPGGNHPDLSALLFTPPPSFFPPPPPFPFPQNPNPNPNPGARLMALLNPNANPNPNPNPNSIWAPLKKKPRGRWLGGGERVSYDVDSVGDKDSELEAIPITKYVSEPVLLLGRQIAVNRNYICYGLKLGAIRVLNCSTALRALLKGHTTRVADMAFFAEDVNLLASASVDGSVFVWKIDEGPDEESMPQISGKVVIAIHFVGDQNLHHPQICWHSHKQEILYVGIKNYVLRINTAIVGKGRELSAEQPLKCSLENLIDGVHLIGKHNGEVTCLSVSRWMATSLASASKDGTLTIWDDSKLLPLITFRPHDGYPVSYVQFMASPHRPEHVNLVTAGPLNQEVKIWAPASNEGWILPNDYLSWQCIQILDFISSSKARLEEAFFNQIVVLPQVSLLICANAKKNAIYAAHIDYGSCPASTHMSYIADFTVTMPILSLIATCDSLPDGQKLVNVYCVQTQAIQQYALDLAQCLPSHATNDSGIEKGAMSHILESTSLEGSVVAATCRTSGNEIPQGGARWNAWNIIDRSNISAALYPVTSISTNATGIYEYSMPKNEYQLNAQLPKGEYGAVPASSLSPLCLDFSGKVPAHATHESSETHYDFDNLENRRVNIMVTTDSLDASGTVCIEKNVGLNDLSIMATPKTNFDLNNDVCGQKNSQKILLDYFSSPKSSVNQCHVFEEVKGPDISDGGHICQHENYEPQTRSLICSAEKEVTSQTPKSSYGDCISNVVNKYSAEGAHHDCTVPAAESTKGSPINVGVSHSSSPRDMCEVQKKGCSSKCSETLQSFSASSQGMQNEQHFQTFGPHLSPSPFNSTSSLDGPRNSCIAPSVDNSSHIFELKDTLNQLMNMQREMQRQMTTIVASPVADEGKRIEASLNQSMEKFIKANIDALWARFEEDAAKREKAEKDRIQQLTNSVTNCLNRDLPAMLERAFKKEMSAMGTVVGRTIAPIITSAISESFQKGVGDKAVNQLEKSVTSKLDSTVAKQIQTQFQVTGKQVLQDVLKSCLESTVVPGFERSCKAAFEQVDRSFQKGFSEHATTALKQFEATHAPLALTLNDAVNSASSITQNLMSELVHGQSKILALIAAGNTEILKPSVTEIINGPVVGLPEMFGAPIDPKRDIARLVSGKKYEEAFTVALQRNDVSIVSWLCTQVDLHVICSSVPLPLSQGVLLALLQQLSCDLGNETTKKASWMNSVAISINPADPRIAAHARTILEQIYSMLNHHQISLPTFAISESANIRLLMHVINSLIMSCR